MRKPPLKRKRATALQQSAPYDGRLFYNPRRYSKQDPIPSSLSTGHDKGGYRDGNILKIEK